jgi:hypothetical protein
MSNLPQKCTNGHNSWKANCFMVFWEIVEPHSPSRVMRQFGMVQNIPPAVPLSHYEHERLHDLKRSGRSDTNWRDFHYLYVNSWNSRHDNIQNGLESETPMVGEDYFRWYREITVVYIIDPRKTNEYPPQVFQDEGGRTQFLVRIIY